MNAPELQVVEQDQADCEIDFTAIDAELARCACAAVEAAEQASLTLATAESCTAGLIAAVLSDAPGAGECLQGAVVTYSTDAKSRLLSVPPALIESEGVASEAVARAMADGARRRTGADIAVAVTGVAGPATDQDGTPVGTMHFALARRDGKTIHLHRMFGDIGRSRCRYAAAMQALALIEHEARARAKIQELRA